MFKILYVTCSLVYQNVTIHYRVFLEALPSQLSYCIIHKVLIIRFFISYLLQSSSKDFINIGLSTPKIISFYQILVYLMAFFRSSLDIKLLRGIFNSFASYNNFNNKLI